jgi:hypothetical protein
MTLAGKDPIRDLADRAVRDSLRHGEHLRGLLIQLIPLMAVLRVEDADAATFRDVFSQAVERVKKIKAAEHVRWQTLMQILLTWVYWRRPNAEQPALVGAAEQAQASVKRKGEIERMRNILGPTIVDLAREEDREVGRQEGRVQGIRESLLKMLQKKFGRLPKKLQRQIEEADDSERLEQALLSVSDCATLGDFRL